MRRFGGSEDSRDLLCVRILSVRISAFTRLLCLIPDRVLVFTRPIEGGLWKIASLDPFDLQS